MKLKAAGVATVMTIWASGPAVAQVRPPQPANPAQMQARREIATLEAVLENAVSYGARMLTQHVQNANIPDMVMLTGMARARGFRLDGYGVVVDVEFPSIRRSVMWSMRALQPPDRQLLAAMREIRKSMQDPRDAAARDAIDRDIRELEADIRATDQQVGAMTAASSAPGSASATVMPGAVGAPKTDIKGVYFNEITSALMDAILDRGAPVGVGAEEWLTVAARESADRGFVSSDPNDTAMTFILRIKGSDLQALRERRLSRDEARGKIEIRQY